jgi:DNA-binding NarL/FixJ family response regulator
MPGNPAGREATFDGTVIVAHPRLLVAETLCLALNGIGIDATLDRTATADFALVDTGDTPTIERLLLAGVIVIAFGSADAITVARALRAGAVAHIGDNISFVDVADHLRAAAAGINPERSGATNTLEWNADARSLEALTRREREVLRLLVSGRRAADIAHSDFVSVTTVRNQIQSILTKLGAHSQLEAVAIAVRAGWTPLAA